MTGELVEPRPGSWRYAVTRERLDTGEDFYALREVYTGSDGTVSWTADPVGAIGDSWIDLCLAFIKDNSPGASMCADLAQRNFIPTRRYYA